MKKLIIVVSVLAFITSCKNTSENKKLEDRIEQLEKELSNKEKEDGASIQQHNETEEVIDSKEETEKVILSDNQYDQAITNFQNCKRASKERADCRNAFTELISKVYKLEEFKDKNGHYKVYDSIQSIVSKSKSWKKLGSATNQSKIDKAVKYANNGGLALIIDTSKAYGHVVLVQAGKTKESGSWGLKLPNVFSLANNNPEKSFQGKPLGYAFKKSKDLTIYIRK